MTAQVVGWDVYDDVGLIRIDPAAHPLTPVPLGQSASVQVGQPVADTLSRLAERAQVLTITHLPQIASRAERHFSVEKIPGDPTHTRIEPLAEDRRREEIERMLGGREFLSSLQ